MAKYTESRGLANSQTQCKKPKFTQVFKTRRISLRNVLIRMDVKWLPVKVLGEINHVGKVVLVW